MPALGELGVLGMTLDGYGCLGRSAVEYGLAALELEAGDSGIRTFVSVQGSLAMGSIHRWGTEEQKQEWLPRMSRGEVIGCFGLTEPERRVGPGEHEDVRRRAVEDGDDWILTGSKRWIGLASIAQLAVVWAQTDDGVRGFIVPTDSPGFHATVLEPKGSMRASIQCELHFDDVRLPAEALLPGARGLRGPFSALSEARYGIIWGALGAATRQLRGRIDLMRCGVCSSAGRSRGSSSRSRSSSTWCSSCRRARCSRCTSAVSRTRDSLRPEQISLGKLNNVREAIAIAREARTILGGDGVLLENSPIRHAANLESVRTYEGTDEVHTLVLGQHLTGIPAFR